MDASTAKLVEILDIATDRNGFISPTSSAIWLAQAAAVWWAR